MTDLDGLIRFRKHQVDEKQKFLSNLYRQAEELEGRKKAILKQMEDEKQAAKDAQDAEASTYLLTYLEGARHKIKVLDREIARMEVRIAAAQEEVRSAFAEQKKVEIVQQERLDREEAAQKAKEDKELDDIAIDAFRKKRAEEEG